MINFNLETVCYITQRARQFHVKEQIVITEMPNSPTEDWEAAMEEATDNLSDHRGLI